MKKLILILFGMGFLFSNASETTPVLMNFCFDGILAIS
ncbi:hypothetical protein M2306_002688 [Myroides gitamensis]|uniref:Uncharacterized protein n=1 Tax=Myroides odoratus TaxID=256 RepID=A0A378U381_MYROD|nr:hypothetical protein [Myroides odoratus]MDH6601994.1 hypothetical protein [Myroides gitamensis]STZ69586.1 Uncharacterised protein [Myroides odoratus]